MADICTFCKQRNPSGGTNHLVLNGGALWIEFCAECGKKETLTNSAGEELTIQQIFDKNDNKE